MRVRARVHLKASEVSLNNLVVGFVPLAIRPSIHSPLCLASGDAAAIPSQEVIERAETGDSVYEDKDRQREKARQTAE